MAFTWLLAGSVTVAVAAGTPDMLAKVWDEFEYRMCFKKYLSFRNQMVLFDISCI